MAPKKKQQEKMNLGTFLADQSLGSWADEMDAQPLPAASSGYSSMSRGGGDGERRGFGASTWERSGSGMGDRAGSSYDRPQFARQELPLPSKPPYTAHLGNLAFDVSRSDIEGFLGQCEVTNVRIVEDKLDQKPKGFGYVEFASLDGLKKALTLTETNFMGRNIRISVADPPKDRAGESNRDFSDWSRKGPLPDLPQNSRRPSDRGGFGAARSFDAGSDAGSERGGDRRRPGFFENENKTRDFSNWERKGPLSPAPGAGPGMRDGGRLREGGPPMERRSSPAWGEGTNRSEAGSRPPRREFVERAPPPPSAAEQDSQWRTGMRPDAPPPAPTPEVSTPTSPAAPVAPKERPRLNLAKRTVSTAEGGAAPDAGESSSKASPFGAARPVDTATKEKEMAEKREVAQKAKAEADTKAREEKAAKDAAARAARAERADKGQAAAGDDLKSPTTENAPRRPSRPQSNNAGTAGGKQGGQQPKENGEQRERERPSFSILRRDAEGGEENEGEDGDVPDADANGTILGDKETKPQEIVREVAKDGAAQNAEPTAEAMDDDGWSTVAAKPKTGKRGGGAGGARALAS